MPQIACLKFLLNDSPKPKLMPGIDHQLKELFRSQNPQDAGSASVQVRVLQSRHYGVL